MTQILTHRARAIAHAVAGRSENCVLHPYIDAVGLATIGWGNRNLIDGSPVTMHTAALSQMEADDLFDATLSRVAVTMFGHVRVLLSDCEAGALLSFTYNVGNGNLASSTLLRLLNKGLAKQAAAQFTAWNRGGHPSRILAGLTVRRRLEQSVFLGIVDPVANSGAAVGLASAIPAVWHAKPVAPIADDLNAEQLSSYGV